MLLSFRLLGYVLVALITFIGLRLFYYYTSFFFAWRRYRQLAPVTTSVSSVRWSGRAP